MNAANLGEKLLVLSAHHPDRRRDGKGCQQNPLCCGDGAPRVAVGLQRRQPRRFVIPSVHSADDIPLLACDSHVDVVKKAARGLVTPQHSRGLARDTGRVAAEYVQDASPKSPARLGSAADVTKARLPVTGSELAAMNIRFGNQQNTLSSRGVRRTVCRLVAGVAFVGLGHPTFADPGADGAALISFLDKEYKPGLLKIGNRGRSPDGNFVWAANFPDELRVPAQKLSGLCAKQGGAWSVLSSPHRVVRVDS